jgi:hypothetical protein
VSRDANWGRPVVQSTKYAWYLNVCVQGCSPFSASLLALIRGPKSPRYYIAQSYDQVVFKRPGCSNPRQADSSVNELEACSGTKLAVCRTENATMTRPYPSQLVSSHAPLPRYSSARERVAKQLQQFGFPCGLCTE